MAVSGPVDTPSGNPLGVGGAVLMVCGQSSTLIP